MATKTKTFQSGREVFAEYIPNYKKPEAPESPQLASPKDDADATVKRLMADFKSTLKLSPKTENDA